MSPLVSLILSVMATVGFFAGIYALILLALEGRKKVASPRLGISSGHAPNKLKVWVSWDTSVFVFQVYRLRFRLTNPDGTLKEMTFSYTFESPFKTSFAQVIELPKEFVQVLEDQKNNPKGLVTVDFRLVEDMVGHKDYKLSYFRDVVSGKVSKLPRGLAEKEEIATPDHATVLSLDHSELVIRRKRLRDLEAAAKAKAAKAPPKPAAPAAAVPAAPAAPTNPSPAPTPSAAPEAKTQAAAPLSIKEMIAQSNAKE